MRRSNLWHLVVVLALAWCITGCCGMCGDGAGTPVAQGGSTPFTPPPNLDIEPEGGSHGVYGLADTEDGEAPPPPQLNSDGEGGGEGPPPIILDSESEGGGEGPPESPVDGGAQAMTDNPVKWVFKDSEGEVGPPSLVGGGKENPALNERLIGQNISAFLAWEDGHPLAVKSVSFVVYSYCGGNNLIKISRNGNDVIWELNGYQMSSRPPRLHADQLPCEFFGPVVGSIQAVKANNQVISAAEKVQIQWPTP